MPDLADLFPGFASHWIDTAEGKIFARSGGAGPPLALLHGFPQTHVMWHQIAPALARHFTVVALDLRGYGWSTAPQGDGDGALYSKREMAKDVVTAMAALGHVRFCLAGHDRGARVGYRLALDHPGRLEKLAVIDIVPTLVMWEKMDRQRALQVYHWSFLAQPAPLPERLIGANPIWWLDYTLASWTAAKSLDHFDSDALAHYRAFFNDPARIHATCEDYRAGATIDLADDTAALAAGQTTGCPTYVLWGTGGVPAKGASPLDAWHTSFAPDAAGEAIQGGHFLPEENPQATTEALLRFLQGR
jgi:haloacetate dehalogenase